MTEEKQGHLLMDFSGKVLEVNHLLVYGMFWTTLPSEAYDPQDHEVHSQA